MTGEPTHTTSKERNDAKCPSYINFCLKSEASVTLCCQLCSNKNFWLHSSTNKNFWKSTSAIKVATMKNTDDFCYEGKQSRATTKSALFTLNKDEWDTKEGALVSP